MLSRYRILDLTGDTGFLCGKILADLGADVVKIERPQGDPSRKIGPFYHDIPDVTKSLYWFAYNNNKRGITLNLESADGRELFKKLLIKAHAIIESFPPGHMERLGLGYPALAAVNSSIVLTRISLYGQKGPYAHHKYSDIVAMAMGGSMFLCGDTDRPPVRFSFPQACFHGAAEAAIGTTIALFHQATSGEGQEVDVSIRESVMKSIVNAIPFYDLNKVVLQRAGPLRTDLTSVSPQRISWPCKDGMVAFIMAGGQLGRRVNKALVDWINSEGAASDFLRSVDWANFDTDSVDQDFRDRTEYEVGQFFRSHTMSELYEGALVRRIMLYPVDSLKSIMANPQLAARDFWVEATHPELDSSIKYPGAFIKSSETPCQIRCRAPLIGEHNVEIYQKELGLTTDELVFLKGIGVI